MAGSTLGIDFGTSNSAAGILADGKPRLIPLENSRTTLPTTFFFEFDTRETLLGDAANQALLDGQHGRFMRALKRVLGTSLMHEERQLMRERVTFVEIIARFLKHIKTRAEAETGQTFTSALSGRPVFFHGPTDPREAQAEADLTACYQKAGFTSVTFLPEPQAAAIASDALQNPGEIGLIVDIGGGTSDFSLFQTGASSITILANHGIRIGGTDFDKSISLDHVMPLLGRGSELRKPMGPGKGPVPQAIYHGLATWEEIPFQYSPQNRRDAKDMAQLALETSKLNRLTSVLENQLGHDLAFAVETGKITANRGDAAQIDLSILERNLSAALSDHDLQTSLSRYSAQLTTGLTQTLKLAELKAEQVDRIIYVGGSSLMSLIPSVSKAVFPNASHEFKNVFNAVADGLAIASARS